MKLIFLDIDGVLNNHHTLGLNHYIPTPLILGEKIHDHLSAWCIYCLNEVIKLTGAKVVVSSTWRLGETKERLQGILDFYGFKGEVVGMTPHITTTGCRRGDEIQHYLDNCGFDVESFVIIDDDSDMKHLLKFLIKTDNTNGMSYKDIKRCINVLNKKFGYVFYNNMKQKLKRVYGYFMWRFFKKWRY